MTELDLARQGHHPLARAAAELAVGPARIGRTGWQQRHAAALEAAERRANERAVEWLEWAAHHQRAAQRRAAERELAARCSTVLSPVALFVLAAEIEGALEYLHGCRSSLRLEEAARSLRRAAHSDARLVRYAWTCHDTSGPRRLRAAADHCIALARRMERRQSAARWRAAHAASRGEQ